MRKVLASLWEQANVGIIVGWGRYWHHHGMGQVLASLGGGIQWLVSLWEGAYVGIIVGWACVGVDGWIDVGIIVGWGRCWHHYGMGQVLALLLDGASVGIIIGGGR